MSDRPKTYAEEPLQKRMELGLAIMVSAVQKIQSLGLVARFRQNTQARVIHIANLEVGLIGPGSRPGHKSRKMQPLPGPQAPEKRWRMPQSEASGEQLTATV